MTELRVGVLTREYPPDIYGGAGVHVDYLTRELRRRIELEVLCFGEPRQGVQAFQPWEALSGKEPYLSALGTLSVDLRMVHAAAGHSLVHSHTWYANLAGHFSKLVHAIPHVMTCHSLEPLRPWKAEQLGGGYALSSFCERTAVENADAVIAVSEGMKRDILAAYPTVSPDRVQVIYNGVDPALYAPTGEADVLAAHGVSREQPYAIFVGRITRQKGIVHLLRAAKHLDPGVQLVLCAGAPDTPEIAREFSKLVEELRTSRSGVIWIQEMLPPARVAQLLSHAQVFVCPSIYEPFGIVNLEAMSCGAAVVASRVGGIPEVVDEGKTGLLVDVGAADATTGEPKEPDVFAHRLAESINALVSDPQRAKRFGEAGRQRVLDHFSWSRIAEQTIELYASVG